MAKVWSFRIHQEYIHSMRHVVTDKDRYELGLAIREVLEEVEDPTEGATPVDYRPGRFYIDLMGYRITFEVSVDTEGHVLEDATSIILLPIEVVDSD